MNLKEKIEFAIWMCQHNHNIALTGSLMLYLRYFDKDKDFFLGREPEDIDFIVDTNDEDEYDFILPPFIEKVETKMSDYDGYEVLARFWYKGTKIEFIETPRFRYDEEYFSSNWYREYKDNTERIKDFCNDFYVFHTCHKNIRLALVSDLVEAKEKYIQEDKNEEYIEKTKEDLNKIYPLLKENYKDEYITILKFYLKKGWYYKKLTEDDARKLLEKIIWDKEVANCKEHEKWYDYIKKITHDWQDKYIEFEKLKDKWYNGERFHVDYKEEKILNKLIYGYEIPFEI